MYSFLGLNSHLCFQPKLNAPLFKDDLYNTGKSEDDTEDQVAGKIGGQDRRCETAGKTDDQTENEIENKTAQDRPRGSPTESTRTMNNETMRI